MAVLCVCAYYGLQSRRGSASCVIKKEIWAVCCVCVVFTACSVRRCAVRKLPVSCVPVSVKCVPVFPPPALPPLRAPQPPSRLSSPGCDRSQLTPPLLWQPENSLEKGQPAPSPRPAGAGPAALRGVGAPSVGRGPPHTALAAGASSSLSGASWRLFTLVNEG